MWETEMELLTKLIELTKQDKMRWEQKLDIQYSEYQGNKVYAYWPQDGKPSLTFNDSVVEEYGIGIEKLLDAIRNQYARQDRNGVGPTAEAENKKFEQTRQETAEKNSQDFKNDAAKFLEAENKKEKNPKR